MFVRSNGATIASDQGFASHQPRPISHNYDRAPHLFSQNGFRRDRCWNFRACNCRCSVRCGAARSAPSDYHEQFCRYHQGWLTRPSIERAFRMDVDTTAACAEAARTAGARIGVWSSDDITLFKHDEDVANEDAEEKDEDDDEDCSSFPRLPADCTIAPCPTNMASVIGKRFPYKLDPPNGWFVDGTAAILHETGEHRNHLEIVWDDGDETCLGLSTHLKPTMYGVNKRWAVPNARSAQELKRRKGDATRLSRWRIVPPDCPCCSNLGRRCHLPSPL